MSVGTERKNISDLLEFQPTDAFDFIRNHHDSLFMADGSVCYDGILAFEKGRVGFQVS